MLIPHLKLTSIEGNELHLYDVQPNPEYFLCDAYNALYAAPEGAVFVARDPKGKAIRVTTEQPIHAGLQLFPGDPMRCGQLPEQPLFRQLEDDDGSTETAKNH